MKQTSNLFSPSFIFATLIIPCLSLTGNLLQFSATSFQLCGSSPLKITASPLSSYLTITVSGMNAKSYSSSFSLSSDGNAVDISMSFTDDVVFRDLTLNISDLTKFSDSSGNQLTSSTFTSQIEYYSQKSNVESNLEECLPYLVWGLLSVIGIIVVTQLIFKVDTTGVWIIVEVLQMCSLLNMLNVAKTTHLTLFLSHLARLNFFSYIPSYFFKLLQTMSSSNLDSQQTYSHSTNPYAIQAPISPSFIESGGNAIVIVFLFFFFWLLASKIKKMKVVINNNSVYRLIDVLLIHFLCISIFCLRFQGLKISAIGVVDKICSVMALTIYFMFMIYIPIKVVNSAEIIMLQKQEFQEAKYFLDQIRVEAFFSRNFYCVRQILRMLLSIGIPLGIQSKLAPGIIVGTTIVYLIIISFLSYRYPVFDLRKLNMLSISVYASFFSLLLFLLLLWSFQQFYNNVSRSSSQQLDSTFIAFNNFLSWSIITLIFISVIISVIYLVFHSWQQYQDKARDKREQSEIQKNLLIELANQTQMNQTTALQQTQLNTTNDNINEINNSNTATQTVPSQVKNQSQNNSLTSSSSWMPTTSTTKSSLLQLKQIGSKNSLGKQSEHSTLQNQTHIEQHSHHKEIDSFSQAAAKAQELQLNTFEENSVKQLGNNQIQSGNSSIILPILPLNRLNNSNDE